MACSEGDGLTGRTVGLLCGGGLLPLRVAQSLTAQGARVVAVAIKGEADPAIEQVADEVRWTGIARLGAWVRLFKDAGADVLLMCGGIRKGRMFDSPAALLPDLRTLKVWFGRLRSKADHTILGAVADEFEREGIPVGSVADYCPDLLAPQGCLSRREPTERQWRDIRFGWPIAKQIAALQVGQCIVVKDQAVVAVEGMDGTDATLKRGGGLAGGEAVAVKVPKEGHDNRFDMPCMGPDTVPALRDSGVSVLAIQAGGTVVLDLDEVRRLADEADVCIVAVEPDQMPVASEQA